MSTLNPSFIAAIAASFLVAACAIPRAADSKIGVDISGVNYSDQPITYIVTDPNDRSSGGAEPVDPFGAGGAMCCFRLPKTWQPGIKVQVEILDTNRNPMKNEIVELPPYVDGKPGRIWAVYYQDGGVGVLSSEYGPPHEKWPGKVKGWPVPTVEYRRKLWERDLKYIKADIDAVSTVLEQFRSSPEETLKRAWEFDQQNRRSEIENYAGPNDPGYIKYFHARTTDVFNSRKKRLDDWMKRKP